MSTRGLMARTPLSVRVTLSRQPTPGLCKTGALDGNRVDPLSSTDRRGAFHPRSSSRHRSNGQRTANRLKPLAHAGQPESLSLSAASLETGAIILDRQLEAAASDVQVHRNVTGATMLHGVLHRFLHNPEHAQPEIMRQPV